ncbi:uncharacterized protein LOC123537308 [Mercenaria mercenaria]|uniref:uncharacterized protein LOC123537308 n=1 Tax=Mercenaria mercenaria TaxID=6596 RepID=UPI00234F294A|nr:uncharacterized protein LOC123537308 [Mercenaria mercenaria]
MDFKFNILLVAATVCFTFQQVDCLQCYTCTNILEPKCGKTWELSEEEAAKYITTCMGENAACRKIGSEDTLKGKMLVTRSCWNTSSEVEVEMNEEFLDCTSIGNQGTSCYCKGKEDGKPCNGSPPILTYMSLIMTVVSILFTLIL